MASPIDAMMQSMGGMAWSSLGGILFVFIIFFVILVVFGGTAFLMWWKSYNIKVTVYQPMGQVKFSKEEMADIEKAHLEGTTANHPKIKEIKFDSSKKRITHGKFITQKGTSYFAMVVPLKKIKPIPLELMFNDGIHLIQLSKDIFIPIPKPNFIIQVGQNVSISVAENTEWITWSNMMSDRINAKYQNPDAQAKQTLYFVIGIAGMVIIGGLILYFVYASAKKGLDVTTFAKNFAQAIQQNPGNLAGIVPK